MGASKAIEVLTGHMVRVLKERRKIKKNANKSAKGKGVKGAGGSGKKTATGSAPAATGSTSATPVPMVVDPMVPISITQAPPNEAGSPIIIVDSDDDGPPMKKRKTEVSHPHPVPFGASSLELAVPKPVVAMASLTPV